MSLILLCHPIFTNSLVFFRRTVNDRQEMAMALDCASLPSLFSSTHLTDDHLILQGELAPSSLMSRPPP